MEESSVPPGARVRFGALARTLLEEFATDASNDPEGEMSRGIDGERAWLVKRLLDEARYLGLIGGAVPRPMSIQSDLPFSEYLSLPAWGSSSLRAMRRGPPARVQWERENPHEDTSATIIGSAAHCLILTPDLYDGVYAHKPDGMSFATKEGKAWRDAHAPGRKILTHAEAQQVLAIVSAVKGKEIVQRSMSDCKYFEATLLWTCSETGEDCKGRPDWINDHRIYDLKVSRHADGRSLAYRAYVEGWMHQLAHNRLGAIESGLDVRGGRLVVVSPTAPHYVWTLEVKPDALDLLDRENIGTLKAMRDCRESGVWPGTPDEWTKIEPPPTALMEFGESVVSWPDDTSEEESF